MTASIFAPDYTETVYWNEVARRGPAGWEGAFPSQADVVVVGTGLTGASAAHTLAAAGRNVVAIDQGEIGGGASSRNAGMLGKGSRQSYLLLAKAAGSEAAARYFSELDRIYDEAVDRIVDEGFDCDFRTTGRFIGALRPDHLDRLIREYEARALHLGEKVKLVRGAPDGIVGSQQYFGGVFLEDSASVNPAGYTAAMVDRAMRAGVRFIPRAAALGVGRDGNGHVVRTPRGGIRCRNVVVATNGYGGMEFPYARARLVPINAYMIATGELPPEVIESVSPARSTNVDSTRANRYYQVSPDGRRLVFGSRTGRRPPGPLKAVARRIHEDMTYLFPQLADAKVSRAWTGRCAASIDFSPHLAEHDGIHYAVGYSFTGLALAPYLGRLAGEWIKTGRRPETAFATGEFPTLPAIAQLFRPLTSPVATRYYAWVDRPARRAADPVS